MVLLLFLFIPVTTLVLLFLKDRKKARQVTMNTFLLLNTFFFFAPLIAAYTKTPPGESMWNENTGGGAVLWLYIIVLPICLIIQLILMVLKIVFAREAKTGTL